MGVLKAGLQSVNLVQSLWWLFSPDSESFYVRANKHRCINQSQYVIYNWILGSDGYRDIGELEMFVHVSFFPIVIDSYCYRSSNCTTDSGNNNFVKTVCCKAPRAVPPANVFSKLMNYMCGTFNGCSVLWVFSLTVSGGWMEVESPFESLHCSALQTFTSGLGFSSWQPRICRADFDFYPQFPPLFFWAVKQDKSGNQEAKMVLIRLHLTINIKVFWKHWGPNENPLMNHSVFGKQREDTNNFYQRDSVGGHLHFVYLELKTFRGVTRICFHLVQSSAWDD